MKFCTVNLTPARKNDILMVMSDLPNGRALARAYFVDDDRPYAVNQRVCALTPIDADPRFLYYLLNRNQQFLQHDDGISQTHLPNSAFEKFLAPFPSLAEQRSIGVFLDRETAHIDRLTTDARGAISLLEERRTALISAAVTGQIDVRGLAAPNAA